MKKKIICADCSDELDNCWGCSKKFKKGMDCFCIDGSHFCSEECAKQGWVHAEVVYEGEEYDF